MSKSVACSKPLHGVTNIKRKILHHALTTIVHLDWVRCILTRTNVSFLDQFEKYLMNFEVKTYDKWIGIPLRNGSYGCNRSFNAFVRLLFGFVFVFIWFYFNLLLWLHSNFIRCWENWIVIESKKLKMTKAQYQFYDCSIEIL